MDRNLSHAMCFITSRSKIQVLLCPRASLPSRTSLMSCASSYFTQMTNAAVEEEEWSLLQPDSQEGRRIFLPGEYPTQISFFRASPVTIRRCSCQRCMPVQISNIQEGELQDCLKAFPPPLMSNETRHQWARNGLPGSCSLQFDQTCPKLSLWEYLHWHHHSGRIGRTTDGSEKIFEDRVPGIV